MDIFATIQELQRRRDALAAAIDALQSIDAPPRRIHWTHTPAGREKLAQLKAEGRFKYRVRRHRKENAR